MIRVLMLLAGALASEATDSGNLNGDTAPSKLLDKACSAAGGDEGLRIFRIRKTSCESTLRCIPSSSAVRFMPDSQVTMCQPHGGIL